MNHAEECLSVTRMYGEVLAILIDCANRNSDFAIPTVINEAKLLNRQLKQLFGSNWELNEKNDERELAYHALFNSLQDEYRLLDNLNYLPINDRAAPLRVLCKFVDAMGEMIAKEVRILRIEIVRREEEIEKNASASAKFKCEETNDTQHQKLRATRAKIAVLKRKFGNDVLSMEKSEEYIRLMSEIDALKTQPAKRQRQETRRR